MTSNGKVYPEYYPGRSCFQFHSNLFEQRVYKKLADVARFLEKGSDLCRATRNGCLA
jgi:hypothetical protein